MPIICDSFANEVRVALRKTMKTNMNGTIRMNRMRTSHPGMSAILVRLLPLTVAMSLVPPILFNPMYDLPTIVTTTATFAAIVSILVCEHPIAVNMAMSFFGTKKEMDVPGHLMLNICSSFVNEVGAVSRKTMKKRMNGTMMRTRMRISQPGTAANDQMAASQRNSGFIHPFTRAYLRKRRSDLGLKPSITRSQSERPSSPMMQLRF
jgi:hypothetical protein